MKVFLSWSGALSHQVALVLRDWLPSVIQAVRPYVSSVDIDKGTRWSTDIAQQLEESTYGIICVTQENVDAPWINFEAGALSKTIDKSYVSPFLLGIKRSDVQGPLLQFQSTVYEKADVHKLLSSINARLPDTDHLSETQLKKSFEIWWPELENLIEALPKTKQHGKSKQEEQAAAGDSTAKILEELLDLARNQQRLLRSPEDLFPPEYFRSIFSGRSSDNIPILKADVDSIRLVMLQLSLEIVQLRNRYPDDELIEKLSASLGRLSKRIHVLQTSIARFGRAQLPGYNPGE